MDLLPTRDGAADETGTSDVFDEKTFPESRPLALEPECRCGCGRRGSHVVLRVGRYVDVFGRRLPT